MKYYLVLSLSMLVASCAVTELTAETEQKNEKQERAGMLRTKSNGGTADSLSLLSKFQSDVELMLLNQIHYRNGQLVLALSREDAADIGISGELYDKYYNEIKKTNSDLADNQNMDKVQ